MSHEEPDKDSEYAFENECEGQGTEYEWGAVDCG
jgi:hypothetical protein